MIRVLIVDDSVTQREIFRRLLSADGDFTVVAEARNGREALEKVKEHNPDVVLMDIHMPEMDGISATRQIMIHCPVPVVVASGTLRKYEIDLAVQAYDAGAVAVVEKPAGAALLNLHRMLPALRRELVEASKAIFRKTRSPSPSNVRPPQRPVALAGSDVIGVCASTGGPPVLVQMFSALPKPFAIPILLVQHISRGFEDGFAQWLAQSTGQSVGLARHGQPLRPGIWLAPNGNHLTLGSPNRIDVIPGAPAEIHCPSGNPLFESMAAHAREHAVGIILTGMGDDGVVGLLSIRNAGGTTIIQDESSCLIWGMPKAAQHIGAAMHELNPAEIGATLAKLRS